MEKTSLHIQDIVNKWDLDEESKEIKKNLLSEWETSLEEDLNSTLFEITNEVIYYSEKIVSFCFKNIFPRAIYELNSSNKLIVGTDAILDKLQNFEVGKAYYFPLRKYNRIESSNTIFINFFNSLGLPDYLGSLDKVEFLLEKKQNFEKEIQRLEEEDDDESLVNFAHANQDLLDFEYLVVVDDFIGSGESLKEYLLSISIYKDLFDEKIVILIICVIEISEEAINNLKEFSRENDINFLVVYERISKDILNVIYNNEIKDSKVNQLNEFYSEKLIYPNEYCINNISVSYINSPNNNVPFIYYETDNWKALFPRKSKSNRKKDKKNNIKERLKLRKG